MSKFIDKIKEKDSILVEKEREKLSKEYKVADEWFRDTGHGRYLKKMDRIEQELKDIDDFVGVKVEKSTDTILKEYEYLEMLKMIKSKWQYIQMDLNLPQTADTVGLTDILKDVK